MKEWSTSHPPATHAPTVRFAWCEPRLLRLCSGAAALRLCRFRRASSAARTERAAGTAVGWRLHLAVVSGMDCVWRYKCCGWVPLVYPSLHRVTKAR